MLRSTYLPLGTITGVQGRIDEGYARLGARLLLVPMHWTERDALVLRCERDTRFVRAEDAVGGVFMLHADIHVCGVRIVETPAVAAAAKSGKPGRASPRGATPWPSPNGER